MEQCEPPKADCIILENLSIGYRGRNGYRMVAERLNSTLCRGTLTCLLGQNGVGKSTLLRTLGGFQTPLAGRVLIESSDVSKLSASDMSRLVSIVLTERPSVPNMKVTEMVALGRQPYTGFWGRLSAADRDVVDSAIEAVGIGPLSERMIRTLSDGERQKVMIAKALAQETPVILLDEPTAFLDYGSKADVLQMLGRLASEKRKTILLSTHDIELAIQTSDNVWLMTAGKLTAGSPTQLAADGSLKAFVEQPGITFDSDTMTIHVTRKTHNQKNT